MSQNQNQLKPNYPICTLDNMNKYYGVIDDSNGQPLMCSVNQCPITQIDCCSIVNKCKFMSYIGSDSCPIGYPCKCKMDNEEFHLCAISSSTACNFKIKYI